MNMARLIFTEIIRLIRVCWTIYFEANPFTFREGDISRSFSEARELLAGTPYTLNHKIITADRLYIRSLSFCGDVVLGGIKTSDYSLTIYQNGEEVFFMEGNPAFAVNANLVLGPGEITFVAYQNSGGSPLNGYIHCDCWERNEDDNSRRLRALSPEQD